MDFNSIEDDGDLRREAQPRADDDVDHSPFDDESILRLIEEVLENEDWSELHPNIATSELEL